MPKTDLPNFIEFMKKQIGGNYKPMSKAPCWQLTHTNEEKQCREEKQNTSLKVLKV